MGMKEWICKCVEEFGGGEGDCLGVGGVGDGW